MFIGLSSLDRRLGIGGLDHDSLLIVKVSNKVKTFLGISLSIQFLSSLKLFIHLLRAFKEVNVHLSLLGNNFAIRSMFLLREIEADWKIERTDLGLHHSRHIHHSSRILHVRVGTLHELRHASITHHECRVHASSSGSHHHFLRRSSHAHPHVHTTAHHHLVVRVPHLSLHRIILLDDINRHRK